MLTKYYSLNAVLLSHDIVALQGSSRGGQSGAGSPSSGSRAARFVKGIIKGTLLVIVFVGKKVGKIGEKCWKNPKKKKMKKKTVRNSAFHQYDQMSLDSPLSWTLIAVHKKGGGGWPPPPAPPLRIFLSVF